MGNYGIDRRFNKPKDVFGKNALNPNGLFDFPNNFSSREEEVMSYRTSHSGQPITDSLADPYRHFLNNGSENEKIAARTRNGYPVPVPQEAKALLGENRVSYTPHTDNGHAFYKTDRYFNTSLNGTHHKYYAPDGALRIGGPIVAHASIISTTAAARMLFNFEGNVLARPRTFGKIPASSPVNATYHIQKAISELAPNKPEINMFAIIGELRQGIPTMSGLALLKERTNVLRGLGKEHLNINFGIVPLISDVLAVCKALVYASDRLRQYEADAGNGVRRKLSFPVVNKTEVFRPSDLESQGRVGMSTMSQLGFNVKNTQVSTRDNATGTVSSTVTQHYSERIWFSGSFTYFVPMGKDLSSNLSRYEQLAQKLFAPGLNAEALWQLQPWSWLADWLFDLETTISSHERIADDNLVINYGFLMATSHRWARQESVVTPLAGKAHSFSSVTTNVGSIRKERLRANPYGFSATTPGALSTMQWSILAALGFSKMK